MTDDRSAEPSEFDDPVDAGGSADRPGTRPPLEFEIEVPGTPEEVWRAIATGPGITSWYVPHTVDGRLGGVATARFGPGPEMEVPGFVTAWEPPNRVVFAGDERAETLAFEWLVEARDGGSCAVRLVNSGFSAAEEWDEQYDGMAEGWNLFLLNLRLHLEHFPGRDGLPMLPMASWPGPRDEAWSRLTDQLGIGAPPEVGARIEIGGAGTPPLAGTVVDVASWRLALVLDEPAPGTAFLAVEGRADADQLTVSVWAYLYGPDREALVARDEPRWAAWLAERAAVDAP